MSTLRELYKLLSPLRLYELGGSTLVDHELAAYGKAFGRLEAELDRIEEESFVATAPPERLRAWERMLDLPQTPLPPADRRSRILHCLGVTPLSFTPQGTAQALLGVGMEAELTEDIPGRSLRVLCRSFMGDFGNLYQMLKAAEKMMPAHLSFTIDTGGADWNRFEEFFSHWQDFDLGDFVWERFDTGSAFEKRI